MSPWCSRLLALLFIQQSLSKYLFVLETPLIFPLGYSLLLQSGQPSKFKGEIKWVVPATSPPFRVSISIHYSLLFPEKVSQSNFASSSFVKTKRSWEKGIQWSPITIFEFWLLLHHHVMTQRQMLQKQIFANINLFIDCLVQMFPYLQYWIFWRQFKEQSVSSIESLRSYSQCMNSLRFFLERFPLWPQ